MTGIDSLKSILDLERKKSYNNRAVVGGLNKYLSQNAQHIRQSINNPQLLAWFDKLDLAHFDYLACNVHERKRWVDNALFGLSSLTESKNINKRNTYAFKNDALVITANISRQRNEKLDSPITIIRGINSRVASKFKILDVETIHDLLYFIPRRYIDYSQKKSISDLQLGEDQTIMAEVWQAKIVQLGNRKGTEVIVGDGTGKVRIVWFNQPYLAKRFLPGTKVVISGTVSRFNNLNTFISPEWEFLENTDLIHTGRLVPIYPLTHGLYHRQVRKWIKEAIDGWIWQIKDFLPVEIKKQCHLIDLAEAIVGSHYPTNNSVACEAKKRLAFDELFLLQFSVLSRKQEWQENQPGNKFNIHQEAINSFLGSLPFSLTRAQEKVLAEIIDDLKRSIPMLRLLQGEVGSGKTVIAIFSLLIAIVNGYQAALMVPTEVLAEQHFRNIRDNFSGFNNRQTDTGSNFLYQFDYLNRKITVALLIGSLKTDDKEYLQLKIEKGEIDLVIGTHALIQRKVNFRKLGLAVIDEQQRFGVLQRSILRQKGFNPHILVMTATPIPRTLALTLYGDLDISILDELPPGRKQVKTYCLEPQDIQKAYDFIRQQAMNSKQTFIICPLIEESEVLETKAAVAEYQYLLKEIFPDLKLALLHGRIPSSEKEKIMQSMHTGEIDILISTSVVEVGIDIPKATVILIEGADRFGLSQLHQLRGRVGRGNTQGYCILLSEKPLKESARLLLMEKIHDGFTLAEKDLEIRGPGDFFGTLQSGILPLKIARYSDIYLLEEARKVALKLLQKDYNLDKDEYSLLNKHLSQVWSENTEWS
jgi:ATP-dependent DNA helicase RecG